MKSSILAALATLPLMMAPAQADPGCGSGHYEVSTQRVWVKGSYTYQNRQVQQAGRWEMKSERVNQPGRYETVRETVQVRAGYWTNDSTCCCMGSRGRVRLGKVTLEFNGHRCQTSRRWVPAKTRTVTRKVWKPGRSEMRQVRRWVPGGTRTQRVKVWQPGHYETKTTRVWVPQTRVVVRAPQLQLPRKVTIDLPKVRLPERVSVRIPFGW